MKKRPAYIIAVLVLLLASCGQRHQAKGVIQTFMEQNVAEPAALSSVSILKLDSTRLLNDSAIQAIRLQADTVKRYKKSISYDEGANAPKLYVARITYSIHDAKFSDTYYLDDQLSRVVAFKSNGHKENKEKS